MVSPKIAIHIIGIISFSIAVISLNKVNELIANNTGATGIILTISTYISGYLIAGVIGPKILWKGYLSTQ